MVSVRVYISQIVFEMRLGGGAVHSPPRPCVSLGPFGGPGCLLPFGRYAETLGEPDAFPVELVNRTVMGEAVQQGRGKGGIAEHAGPLGERQVRHRRRSHGTWAAIIPTFNAVMLLCWTSFFRKPPSPVFTVRRTRLLMYKISVGLSPQTGTRITHRSVWRRLFKDRNTGDRPRHL